MDVISYGHFWLCIRRTSYFRQILLGVTVHPGAIHIASFYEMSTSSSGKYMSSRIYAWVFHTNWNIYHVILTLEKWYFVCLREGRDVLTQFITRCVESLASCLFGENLYCFLKLLPTPGGMLYFIFSDVYSPDSSFSLILGGLLYSWCLREVNISTGYHPGTASQ